MADIPQTIEPGSTKKNWKDYFAFVKDKNFWKVLLLGQRKYLVFFFIIIIY
jgi:hypothetical protein